MLPSLSISLCLGLLCGSFFPYFPLSSSSVLLAAILVSGWAERRYGLPAQWITACFASMFAGMLLWSLAGERFGVGSVSPGPLPDAAEEVTGRIVAPVQQGTDRLVLLVESELAGSIEAPRRIRLTWRMPERLVFEGDRIRFQSKFRRPSGSLNPGGFDYAAYLMRQGVDAVATVSGPAGIVLVESGRAGGWWAIWNQVDRWRGSIRLAAIQSLSQPALGIFLGIVIGDRGFLEADLRDVFMITGTVHLLSISGSHLGLVAVLFFVALKRVILHIPSEWLLRLSRHQTPTRIAALLTVIPVSSYAVLAGAEVATVRSLIMILMALLAKWLGTEQRIFHALALAAGLIVLHDPVAIYDISFQLSFLSVLAIALWLGRGAPEDPLEERPASRWSIWLGAGREAVVMSAVVTLVTIPVVAYYFNQVPWLGLITNALAVPFMGICLVPLGLVASIIQLVAGGNELPLATPLQWLTHVFVSGLTAVGEFPGGEWHVAAPSLASMGLYFGLLATAWSVGRREWKWRAGTAAGLILVWWIWSPRVGFDGTQFRVTFLDVGQGDSAVVELPDGQVFLIDGGSTFERFDMGRGVVGPYLWNRGIRTLDHVVATHPQLDHVGGLAWILQHFPVRHYWSIGERREEAFYGRLEQALNRQGVTERMATEGMELAQSSACRMLVLNPSGEHPSAALVSSRRTAAHALNNHSLVTRLTCGSHAILFAADVETEALSRMLNARPHEQTEVVKVPHHGALSSLHHEWIAAARPTYAIVSAGKHNAYGHPAAPVLEAYQAAGSRVFRTDLDGGVWVTGETTGSSLVVHRTADLAWRPVSLFGCVWECERTNWSVVREQWRQRWE